MSRTNLLPGIVNTVKTKWSNPICSIAINRTTIPKQRAVTYKMQNDLVRYTEREKWLPTTDTNAGKEEK